jgi:hypothetical protein
MENLLPWIFWLLTGLGSLAGGYLGAYFSKKGENRAIREDLKELTKATEEIKASISHEVWGRQKRWEAKEKAFFDAISHLAYVQNSLLRLYSTYVAAQKSGRENESEWKEQKLAAHDVWSASVAAFEKAMNVCLLVCNDETKSHFQIVDGLLKGCAGAINRGEGTLSYDSSTSRIQSEIASLTTSIRQELEINSSALQTAYSPPIHF